MQIPLDMWNVSPLLAVTAIMLLISAKLVSAYDGPMSLLIDQRKLEKAAVITGVLFLVTTAIRLYEIAASR